MYLFLFLFKEIDNATPFLLMGLGKVSTPAPLLEVSPDSGSGKASSGVSSSVTGARVSESGQGKQAGTVPESYCTGPCEDASGSYRQTDRRHGLSQ